jgi:Permuted papain-like amidase enzyme, YaeF/YiiX, C92 family
VAKARDLDLEDGDIIFQNSSSRQSAAIAAATNSLLTHVGIIFLEDGQPMVYEAVQPVKKTSFKEWTTRGKNGSYVVRRLKDKSKLDMAKLKKQVFTFLGKDYDSQFGWSDARIYCSEFVYKAYDRAFDLQIGTLKTMKDLDLTHPVVKQVLQERYGNDVPMEMKIISPVDVFESNLLQTVTIKQ